MGGWTGVSVPRRVPRLLHLLKRDRGIVLLGLLPLTSGVRALQRLHCQTASWIHQCKTKLLHSVHNCPGAPWPQYSATHRAPPGVVCVVLPCSALQVMCARRGGLGSAFSGGEDIGVGKKWWLPQIQPCEAPKNFLAPKTTINIKKENYHTAQRDDSF